MAQVARDVFDEYFFSAKTAGYAVISDSGIVTWEDSAETVTG